MQRLIQRHIRVHGEVHETGFRSAMQREAVRLGAVGWVRNVEGGVEAVVQGRESVVQNLVWWCQRGPLASGVERVEVTEQPREAFHGFDVRR